MKKLKIALSISAIFFFGCASEEVDLIVHNAKIYTVDDDFSIAEAMAIRADTIVEIGPEHQILNKYSADKKVDAATKFVYPGFIDAHCHFYGYGMNSLQVNLVGTTSWEEVLDLLREKAKNSEGWIIGRGWDQNDWQIQEFPDKTSLEEFGDRPIILKRIDGHAVIVNQNVLDLASITSKTKIEGGIIELKDGEPSGILIDNAVDIAQAVIPKSDKQKQMAALLRAQKDCLKEGLTTVDDAGLDYEVIQLIDEMQQSGDLKIKVYAMASPTEKNLEHYLSNGIYLTDRLSVRSFKLYADGALGSRGAKLIDPYSDVDEEYRGLLIHEPEYFDEIARKVFEAGFQLNTHAIGDSANRLILETYGKYLEGVNDHRWRIEHAQVIDPNDFELFREYTIIPSVQPTHATSDMPWAGARLGEQRLNHAYAYRKLMEQNGLLALGTDFPVEEISPIKTFYAAISRKDVDGNPPEGFLPDNSLSRQNALKGMTIWAAISNFEEGQKGSLIPGKQADFVILDRDLMKENERSILESKVLYTFINGKEVFTSTETR